MTSRKSVCSLYLSLLSIASLHAAPPNSNVFVADDLGQGNFGSYRGIIHKAPLIDDLDTQADRGKRSSVSMKNETLAGRTLFWRFGSDDAACRGVGKPGISAQLFPVTDSLDASAGIAEQHQQFKQQPAASLDACDNDELPTQVTAFDLPHPVKNPSSPLMLTGDWLPNSTHQIDFARLPKVPSQHVVINDVSAEKGVNQHNYLTHFDGKLWCMWSDGPGHEDRVGQRVKFATSPDGLKWTKPRYLTPIPPNSGPDSPHYNTRSIEGMRWISRGFWQRDGELLALVALDEAAGFFGPSLELRAFRWDNRTDVWQDAGVVYDNAINNFPPLQLHTGDWMMSRRPYNYKKVGVQFLVGGNSALNEWKSFPVLGTASTLKAEEPDWWILPDQNLVAIFRDNKGSKFIYRAFSSDDGRTWSTPVKTNFPDATSKMSGLRLRDGRYVLVSNPNPKKRDPLAISISNDGIVFDKMFYLVGGRHVDYPHVMEHDGCLYIAFASKKASVEVLKVQLKDLNQLRN